MDGKELLAKVGKYLPDDKLGLVAQAHRIALDSGKPALDEAVETASILADLQLDADCLAAALLAGLPQDGGEREQEVEAKLGSGVWGLVRGVARVSSIPWPAQTESQAESLRRMFLAMAEDIRVILISLAIRLQIMRNLRNLPPEERQAVAQETREIYAPLAHRLGIWQLRWELEDLSFRWLQPDDYREIANLLDVKKNEWERYLTYASRVLKDAFQKAGLRAEVAGRPKTVHSIYAKMQKYDTQGKEFSEINDLVALRVLVDEVPDCYNALGIVHSLWHPLLGQFDDFIANPKGNMYQSLHTTVMALEGKPLEIQIRTHEMHRTAEYGVAAHWRYKEGTRKDIHFEEKMAWLRQLMDWQKQISGAAFVESVKTDVFQDQVYVFTPAGEIRELPYGSTPLDFAYRIHTDLGHRCTGAKVNGRLVALTQQLQNGDVVDILSTKSDRGPSLDWLNPHLGYVRTHQARERIRQWFRKRERAESLERGQALLEKELRRLGASSRAGEIASLFGYDDQSEFLIAIGCGDISVHQIGAKLVPEEATPPPPRPQPRQTEVPAGVQVLGVGDLLTRLAPCCAPVPGDDIVGFVTRAKGVTIHRKSCANIASEDEKERLVPVGWGPLGRSSYPASVYVKAQDRVGLIKDISTLLSEAKVNIASISSANHQDATVSIYLTLDITDIGHLSRLLSRIEGVRGVISASRIARDGKTAGELTS